MIQWLVILWINPTTHHVEFGEQHSVFESVEACEKAKQLVDLPAVLYRDKEGNRLYPAITCVTARK